MNTEPRRTWDADKNGYYWYRVKLYSETKYSPFFMRGGIDWAFFRIQEGGYETGETSDVIQHIRMLEGLMRDSADLVVVEQCSFDSIEDNTEYYTIEFGLDVKWPE